MIAVDVVNIKIKRKTVFVFFFSSITPVKNKTHLVRSMKDKTTGGWV